MKPLLQQLTIAYHSTQARPIVAALLVAVGAVLGTLWCAAVDF